MCVAGTARLWGIYPCDGKIDVYRCTACWLKNRGIPLWWLAWLFSKVPDCIAIKMRNTNNKLGTLLSMRRLFIERQEREKRLFDSVERIVAVSRWLYGVLRINNHPEQKLYFCPHGLMPTVVQSKPLDGFKIPSVLCIGFIGRFNHVKGLHILVKAVKRLPLNRHIELRIYGLAKLNEERDYLKLIQKLTKGDSRIKLCGELTDKNRQDVFMDLDILAVPSIWLETGPYVVLEAFSKGVPIIGSDLGGIVELVTDRVNGLLVKPGNVRAWTQAISWIYEHPEVLDFWARNIPSVRSSKDVASEMTEIYKKVLDSQDNKI
jgi:glycosyltransferase involved in cell wall biosynthesis